MMRELAGWALAVDRRVAAEVRPHLTASERRRAWGLVTEPLLVAVVVEAFAEAFPEAVRLLASVAASVLALSAPVGVF